MSDYKNPLQIHSSDPLCSATTLGDTVIGVLFEKKGTEIKKALLARIAVVDKKIEEYKGVIEKVEVFILEKRKILKELDEYCQDRSDKKGAVLLPFQKELDEIRRKYNEQCNDINNQLSQTEATFNKETLAEVGPKAVAFEESFDIFKKDFSEIDDFLKKDESGLAGIRGYQGPLGQTGIQGSTGVGTIGTINDCTTLTNSSGTCYYTTTSGNVGIGMTPSSHVSISSITKEDLAMSRLSSLRNLLQNYNGKILTIKECIETLDQERRRLSLIANNVDEDRKYKLDLNKLSAFGFEDIEVK